MLDGTPIDFSVFVSIDFNEPIKTLEIYSEDMTKLGTYEFHVTVYYESKPIESVSSLFKVQISECESLDPDTAIWQGESYLIGSGKKTLTWNP